MTKGICKHLESKLPSLVNGKISQESMSGYSKYYEETMSMDEYEDKCFQLEKALRFIGLNNVEVSIVMDRYVSKLSIKEICNKHGMPSKMLDDLLKTLDNYVEVNKNRLNESLRSEDNG